MDRIVGKAPIKIDIVKNYDYTDYVFTVEDDYSYRLICDEAIIMTFADGSSAIWYHQQNCCENVVIEDVCGDWNDLLNTPLLVAECRTNENYKEYEHETWTFYTFRSIKGTVDVRWYGSSNGYYSESVDFIYKEVDYEKSG